MEELDRKIETLIMDRMELEKAAEALGISKGAVYNKFCSGELRRIKAGRKVYASKKQVVEKMEQMYV